MATNAGQAGGASTDTIPYPDADDTVSPGDAAAIAGGDLEAADGDAGHEFLGVRARRRATNDGDQNPVHVSGPVVAAVEATVSAGDGLDVGNTTNSTVGQLETSAGGPAYALSDENGEWNGQTAPAGHAWVLL